MKTQKSTKSTAEIVYVVLALIAGALIILFSNMVRIGNANFYPIGYESYHNIRIADNFLDTGSLIQYDPLSNGGRSVGYNFLWPLMLAWTSKALGTDDTLFASRLLPLIFSLLSFIVLYFILRKIMISKMQRIIFVFLFVLSPPFIYMSAINSYYSFAMLLSLFSFYLFLKNKFYLAAISVVLFSLIGLLSHMALIVSLVLFGFYIFFRDKKSFNYFVILCGASVIVFILYFKFWLTRFISISQLFVLHLPDGSRPYGVSGLSGFIAEFGSEFGLGFFILVISIFGLYVLWETKYKQAYIYLMIIFLFVSSLYFDFALFYLNLFFVFLACLGLDKLISRKFESQTIKTLVIVLLLCGVVFDGVSYARSQESMSPTIRDADMMSFIKERTLSNAIIFAYYKNGDFISYAGKRNVLDLNLLYTKDYYTRWSDSNTIFHPESVRELKGLLDKYQVDYIWIDTKSQKAIYAKDKLASDELPLFIYTIRNDKSFRLVFKNFESELYRYQKVQ